MKFGVEMCRKGCQEIGSLERIGMGSGVRLNVEQRQKLGRKIKNRENHVNSF